MEGSAQKRRICRNEEIAGDPSCTHPSTEGDEMVTPSGYEYEVFLSFRGPDTRSGFTDFLYTSLNDAGIRTFKDDEELRVGEEFAPELLQAINQSKILIPIFSKGYASSAWCLKELVRMVECQKVGRQKIMPIFYDVAPSEVRYQTGCYRDALLEHENKKRYGEDIVKEWKATLSAVGKINGWDLHCKSPRREGEFAKKLTEEVFRVLKKAYLAVSDCLVNVDKHVDAIMEKIGAQISETRILGIHGMGGIGKTTIAKIIFNILSHDFENCCFLPDIRETSKANGIQCLQSQLIYAILKTERTHIKDIDEGNQIIKCRLSNKRVLLLLDDMEEEKHIDVLVGKHDWFGNGSKVIITTRNKDILNVPEVDISYELSVMDLDQSLQLFSRHAFRRDSPLNGYIDQSKRAISIAGGLPLALEVIGSVLCRTKKEMWDVKLKKLESVLDDRVLSKLKISYDALNFRQERIFLDIACLFIRHNKDVLVYFWDEPDFFPEEAMIVLENMSLIKINEDNTVWMHDQLRDLGREMIRQKSNMKIEKQSRVWDPKVGYDLLRRRKGKKEVEALRLKLDHPQRYCFTCEDFENLSDLRFLQVDGPVDNFIAEERLLWHESLPNVPPATENSYLLPQLRWLSWKNIPPTFNVTKFSMEDLVVLDLSDSKITDDWIGWSHMEVMKNLKSLDLSRCRNLRSLPDKLCSNLARLEYLSLKECTSLEMLPDTLGNLKSLIELDISNTSIKKIPDSFGKLKNLKVVKMREVHIWSISHLFWTIEKFEEIYVRNRYRKMLCLVEIGDGIYRNQSLRILSLINVSIDALPPRLPESIIHLRLEALRTDMFPDLSNLNNLKELDLSFSGRYDSNGKQCGFVEDPLPRWIGNLSKLESLALKFYGETAPPTDISLPPRLKSLRLFCPNLRCLPRLPSSLSSLQLDGCSSLCSMEDVSDLKNLLSLRIKGAAITEIRGLARLENLRDLTLSSLKQVQILPDLSNLDILRSLKVSHCDNLVEIQGELPRCLERLRISSCPSLWNLPDLSSLVGKQQVEISDCGKLKLEAILGFARKNQQDLKLVGFNELHILPDISESNGLRRLKVSSCHNLVEIQGELPQSLEELEISYCTSLHKLPIVSNLKKLRKVEISHCENLNVEAILGFARMNPLNLQLQILPDLSKSDESRCLRVDNYSNLVEVQADASESLEQLHISFCEALYKLPDLSSLMGLRKVCISSCANLVEIQGELPQSLEILNISCCESLLKLPDLSSLMGLRKVCISSCANLVEIQGELPESLETLYISCCESLLKLPNLLCLTKLQKVHIGDCMKLEGEAILGSSHRSQVNLCKNLQYLQICGLGQLETLLDLSNSNKLRDLRVEKCDNLLEIQGKLPDSLKELEIFSCKSLQKLPDLSSLMGLREVCISSCADLVEIPGKLPESLEVLNISCCQSLLKLPDLSCLKKLQRVNIGDCMKLEGEAILGSSRRNQVNLWENLQHLQICGLGQLETLFDLGNSNKLRHLRVEKCDNLLEIQGKLPDSLKELEIFSCKSLQKLPDLSSLMGLRKVCISSCADLVEIPGKLPQALEVLTISCCESLLKLPDLSCLKKLQRVNIGDCMKLEGEAILGSSRRSQVNLWENLQHLQICGLGQLETLLDLSNSNKLRHLRVEKCDNLLEIHGKLPESLKELEIFSCKSLQKLPDLSSLMGLQEVCISSCANLVEIQGKLPESLKILNISCCGSLLKLPDLSCLTKLQRVNIEDCMKLEGEAILGSSC